MARCSTCGRSNSNCTCSSLTSSEQTWSTVVLVIAIVVVSIVLFILLPGMALNYLLGRFGSELGPFISASMTDSLTWFVSIMFWWFIIYWYHVRDKSKPTLSATITRPFKSATMPTPTVAVNGTAPPALGGTVNTTQPAVKPANVRDSGPFRLRMGMRTGDIGMPHSVSGNRYLYQRLPYGHSFFNEYQLRISPTKGLYCIEAIKTEIPMHDGGYTLLSEFRSITAKYEKHYGGHVMRDDTTRSSSKQIIAGSAVWWNKAALPKDTITIEIAACRAPDGLGQIIVTYQFSNVAACQSEAFSQTINNEDDWL